LQNNGRINLIRINIGLLKGDLFIKKTEHSSYIEDFYHIFTVGIIQFI
jgi:hypothetical protein